MPLFSPTITINTVPAVTISGSNITYDQVKNSLGDYAYLVDRVYIWADNPQQITGVALYNYLDATGVQRYVALTPTKDPYQNQPALYYDLKPYNVVFNGNSQLSFNLLPNVYLQLTFYSKRVGKQDKLNELNPSNFKLFETEEDLPDFFENWQEQL